MSGQKNINSFVVFVHFQVLVILYRRKGRMSHNKLNRSSVFRWQWKINKSQAVHCIYYSASHCWPWVSIWCRRKLLRRWRMSHDNWAFWRKRMTRTINDHCSIDLTCVRRKKERWGINEKNKRRTVLCLDEIYCFLSSNTFFQQKARYAGESSANFIVFLVESFYRKLKVKDNYVGACLIKFEWSLPNAHIVIIGWEMCDCQWLYTSTIVSVVYSSQNFAVKQLRFCCFCYSKWRTGWNESLRIHVVLVHSSVLSKLSTIRRYLFMAAPVSMFSQLTCAQPTSYDIPTIVH